MVLVFAILSHNAYASIQTGHATSCSGLASCHYTITGKSGSGWASTSAFVGGYVGQSPLPFSGGSAYFQLPGEPLATYNGIYSGQGVLAGYSSTAGTIYHVTGTFKATDANTGNVTTGSTDDFVGIKGHAGRGGGNTYILINGTIKINESKVRTSSISLACSPSSISPGGSSTCNATVTDPGPGSASTPTGKVTFTQSPTGSGAFSPANSCTLVSGSCSVTFTEGENDYCSVSIVAKYVGDKVHQGSTSTGSIISITGC
jgi:hypothetical protein